MWLDEDFCDIRQVHKSSVRNSPRAARSDSALMDERLDTGTASPRHHSAAAAATGTPPSDRVTYHYSSQSTASTSPAISSSDVRSAPAYSSQTFPAAAAAQRPFYAPYASSYHSELLPKEDVDTYLQSIEPRQSPVVDMFTNPAALSAMTGMGANMPGYPSVSPHANGYLGAAGANSMYAPTSRGLLPPGVAAQYGMTSQPPPPPPASLAMTSPPGALWMQDGSSYATSPTMTSRFAFPPAPSASPTSVGRVDSQAAYSLGRGGPLPPYNPYMPAPDMSGCNSYSFSGTHTLRTAMGG